jgi:hypothetical protein
MSFFLDSSQNPWNVNNSTSIYRLLSGFNKTSRMLEALNGGPFNSVNKMLHGHNHALRSGLGGLYRVLEDIKRSNDNLTEYYNDLNKSLGNVLEEAFPYRTTNERETAGFKVTEEIVRESINSIYENSTSEERIEINTLFNKTTEVLDIAYTIDGITIFLDAVKETIREISESKILGVSVKGWFIMIIQSILTHYTTQIIAAAFSSSASSEPQIIHYQTKIVEVQQEINNAVLEMLPVVTATTTVHIRTKPSKKSKSLLLVQEGQDVKVIEEKYKWIYISVKEEGDCLIEGWAYKEYFE